MPHCKTTRQLVNLFVSFFALSIALEAVSAQAQQTQPQDSVSTTLPVAPPPPANTAVTTQFTPFVCLGDVSRLPPPTRGPGGRAPTLSDGCQSDPRFASGVLQPVTAQGRAKSVLANSKMWVLIRVIDSATNNPRQLDPTRDELEVIVRNGDKQIQRRLTRSDIQDSSDTIFGIELGDFSGAPHRSVVTVEVRSSLFLDKSYTGYFTLVNPWSPYGVAKTGGYFWVPVGLFASNFQSTEKGIPFSAFPIGAAGGVRRYLGKNGEFYVGGSLMINYVIYPTKEGATDGTSSSTVNFQGGAVGLLADFNNIFYLGGAYVADLRSNQKDPGLVVVAGIGPGALQWLQSISK